MVARMGGISLILNPSPSEWEKDFKEMLGICSFSHLLGEGVPTGRDG